MSLTALPSATLVAASTLREKIEALLPASHRIDIIDYDLEKLAEGRIIVCPGGTRIDGDLALDWESMKSAGDDVVGIFVDGHLAIAGDLVNENWDGGPFLIVRGGLHLGAMRKRGAVVVVLGRVKARGILLASYNHGALYLLGGLIGPGLINDDHRVELAGAIDAPVYSRREDDIRDYLVDAFFETEDDEAWPIDDLDAAIANAIPAGRPVFRPDAPRGR